MTKDTKGVRQVLVELIIKKVGKELPQPVSGYYKTAIDEALATLQEIMLGMLPEKIKLGKAVYKNVGDGYASERIGYKHGFNDALADMEQNIRGGFNNG